MGAMFPSSLMFSIVFPTSVFLPAMRVFSLSLIVAYVCLISYPFVFKMLLTFFCAFFFPPHVLTQVSVRPSQQTYAEHWSDLPRDFCLLSWEFLTPFLFGLWWKAWKNLSNYWRMEIIWTLKKSFFRIRQFHKLFSTKIKSNQKCWNARKTVFCIDLLPNLHGQRTPRWR